MVRRGHKGIVVLWYRTDSKLSGLIRWVTRSEYSHVAIMVDGVLYEALAKGVVKHTGEEASCRRAEAVAQVVVEASIADVAQAKWWLEQRVDGGYSVLGFIAAGIFTVTGWAPVLALPGEYICSGLAAYALLIAGVRIPGEARLQTPASLVELLKATALDEPEERLAA